MSELKQYWVTVPVDCHIGVFVEAMSEEEAEEKALGADIHVQVEGVNSCRGYVELEHFELIEHVNTGNVCHITHWDIEAEEC